MNTRLPALLVLLVLSGVGLSFAQTSLFNPAPGSPVDVGEGSGHLVLADVNRDGKPDLISQHLMQKVVTVQPGDGTGRFVTAPGSPLKLKYMPGEVKVGDINGDRLPDLAISQSEHDAVDVYFGDGAGRFSLAPGSPFLVSQSPEFNTHNLQLADINEDGKLDIITTSNQRNSLTTMFGNGRGGFSPGPASLFPAGQGRYAFAFSDLDGDGHLDAAITNSGKGDFPAPERVIVLRGDGKGRFTKLSETEVPAGPRYVTAGDLNGDQRPDLAISHTSGHVSTLLNQGKGQFKPGPGYDLLTDLFGLVIADANGDQKNDLVVATVDSVTVLLNETTKFSPAPGSPYSAGPGAYHLTVGDVNLDGRPDIAASSFGGRTVTVLLRK